MRHAFAPWRIIRLLSLVLGLSVLVTVEFAVSIPVLTATLFIWLILRLPWLESWLVCLILSLVVATLYSFSWPLTFLVLAGFVLGVMAWRSQLRGQFFRILSIGLVIGILPAVFGDVVITERVIGMSFLSMAMAGFLVWKGLKK